MEPGPTERTVGGVRRIGRAEVLMRAAVGMGHAYADRVEQEHALSVAAIADGKLESKAA